MTQISPLSRKRLRFKNPPIVEAVLAFGVFMLPDSTLGALESAAEFMKARGYGEVEPVWQHQFQIKIENGESASGENRRLQLGFKFKSDDGLHAVQFNRTGIIFSRLGKYESWEYFRDEARELWKLYSGIIGEPKIMNIGVRYINKLFIPINEQAEDYVTIYPNLPSEIVQRIDGLQLQLVLPIAKPAGRLVHTQILLPPEREGYASLLFDNDFQFDTSGISNGEVWPMLELIRDIKDDYFEHFTTEKMRKTFDA
jgi:uncharacterized protein (TIGR04255 family)